MDKIKRFIECYVPVTACNLKCSYCYIIQENRREGKLPQFKYSPEYIGQALSKDRLGGTAYINLCGAGETLLPKEMKSIIENLLKQGHYVNITTNGTISQRFDEILEIPHELLKHLHFAFSFHYIELKKRELIDTFFDNINKIKPYCSFLVQLNLCDEYIDELDTIKQICKDRVGAFPQVAATRNEKNEKIKLLTKMPKEEYERTGKTFKSPLFDFTMKNFMVKRWKNFCYAGDWSFILNLENGNIKKCYEEKEKQNIFEDINKPIKFEAIGCSCNSPFCVNSSHFMSLGIIPSINTISYGRLRNREEANWYKEEMAQFLDTKLYESNKQYGVIKKTIINARGLKNKISNKIKYEIKKRKISDRKKN